jgi:hypothetical protein
LTFLPKFQYTSGKGILNGLSKVYYIGEKKEGRRQIAIQRRRFCGRKEETPKKEY